jgi:undecaprenyl diphosphate synthase
MPTMPPLDPREVLGLAPEALPRHVAIIMDGNGRWARQRGLPRIVVSCARRGVQVLTINSFSLENWKRPQGEVSALMALYAEYLAAKRPELMENEVRLLQIGRRNGLPPAVLAELERTMELTRDNRRLTLCLALNYGSRAELTDCVRAIAGRVQRGELKPEQISEQTISDALYTAGLPDPDLLIRTAGEMRISNFLLWQISYAELYVTPVLWPDFRPEHLYAALRAYGTRERRFGAVPNAAPGHPAGPGT